MRLSLCPSCSHANPVHASFCNACGLALALRCPHCAARNDLGSRHCHECGNVLGHAASGMVRLPLGPVVPPVPGARPDHDSVLPSLSMADAVWIEPPVAPGPAVADPSADEFTLNLIDLDTANVAPGGPVDQEPQPELIQSDPETIFPELGEPEPPAAAVASDPGTGVDASTRTGSSPAATPKAKRRAAVRRARLATEPPLSGAPAGLHDVLVLDEDADSRAQLCGLLDGFGFCTHPVCSHGEARAALAIRDFAAVFLHIALDGTDSDSAADLCLRARQPPAHGGGTLAALVIVGSGARPVERVRASMAGANQFLVTPASRGDVARALGACGVLLPSDPRRA